MIRSPCLALLIGVLCAGALLVATSGCDTTGEQHAFEAQAAQPPSGITHTDMEGNVIGEEDPDDWRTSPLFPTVRVSPAYPNPVPASFTGVVRVPINIPFTSQISGGLRLLILDPRPPGRVAVLNEIPPHSVFEFVELSFTLAGLQSALQLADPRGLYRLYVHDGAGRLISYGDLRVG
jgi:hypothetical protein